MFVITVMYAPSGAASDARNEAAPLAPEGLAGKFDVSAHKVFCLMSPPAYVTVIANTSTKYSAKLPVVSSSDKS